MMILSRKQVAKSITSTPNLQHGRRKLDSSNALMSIPAWVNGIPLQPKLTVNEPGDLYEQEADAVAEQVMRMPAPVSTGKRVQRCACGGTAGPNGECEECKARRLALQRKGDSVGGSEAPQSVHQTLNRPGQPLDDSTRDFMGSRFGADFSGVRVHTDSQAAQSAQDVSALAYTVGSDVVFGAGQYAPGTEGGKSLIAHELTHVVQQRNGQLQLSREDDESERNQPASPDEVSDEEAAIIGRDALQTVGYERIIQMGIEAGLLQAEVPSETSESGVIQRTANGNLMRDAATFGAVFTRYAVAAGITSQLDSPAPGPADLIAIGILLVGLGVATYTVATSSTTARTCPPCPANPPPEIDRVPPSDPHFPCPGDHWHYREYNQNPQTCVCHLSGRKFGGCCGTPGAPC